jgi:hypothetical protein
MSLNVGGGSKEDPQQIDRTRIGTPTPSCYLEDGIMTPCNSTTRLLEILCKLKRSYGQQILIISFMEMIKYGYPTYNQEMEIIFLA